MKKILSIDDSKAVHAYLDTCFETNLYNLTHAYSAEEGLDLLKKDKNAFDLILLDWEMPKMTGPEALIEMKKIGVNCPIIMVTTRNNIEEIKDVLMKGASEYIMKPFTADIIKQKINDIVGLSI